MELEAEYRKIQDTIPAEWESANKQYKELALSDKKARATYRRNADSAYEALQNVLAVLNQTDALEDARSSLEGLWDVYDMDDRELAMARIKEVESLLGDLLGTGEIKSPLSKSRRALKGDSPKVDEAREKYAETMALYDQELQWRRNAAPIVPQLNQYDLAIRDTIGLRMQPRLSNEQAKDVAACLSHHRDISLNF